MYIVHGGFENLVLSETQTLRVTVKSQTVDRATIAKFNVFPKRHSK